MINFTPLQSNKSGINFTPSNSNSSQLYPPLPEPPKPRNFLTDIAAGVVKPFARLGTNLVNAGQIAMGQPQTQPFSGDFLGEVKPVGTANGGGLSAQNLKDSLGTGLEVASYLPIGGGVAGAGKAAVKGIAGEAAFQGVKSGATAGALQGAGGALQRNEGVIGTATNTLLGGAAGGVLGGVTGGALGLAGKTIKGLTPSGRLANELQDTLDTIKPKLTPTEEAAAKAAGRGKTGEGLLKTTTIEPTKREVEMAQHAREAGVNSGNTFDKNIQLMKDAQKTSATNLRSGLGTAQGTWNRNDIVKTLNDIKPPLTIKSDPTLSKLANNFKKAIVDLSKNMNKKPVGLLDLRQGVDDLIDEEFPSNIYSKDTPVGQFVRKVRSALNDMAESKLPDGQLPNGATFKGELRKQNLLYDAIDNVSTRAPKEGESARPMIQKAKALIKKHPYISGGITGAVGGGAVTGVIKNL